MSYLYCNNSLSIASWSVAIYLYYIWQSQKSAEYHQNLFFSPLKKKKSWIVSYARFFLAPGFNLWVFSKNPESKNFKYGFFFLLVVAFWHSPVTAVTAVTVVANEPQAYKSTKCPNLTTRGKKNHVQIVVTGKRIRKLKNVLSKARA